MLSRKIMHTISPMLYAFAVLAGAASAAHTAPMNKCVANGNVTYQQGPCPSTQARKDPTLEELNAAERKRRAAAAAASPREASPAPNTASSSFRCDGRKYCSQMTSCAEAKYFLAKCPGVKMDGDNDGIPCEEQWCSP
ncbi:MAG TPA: excalibur calcium-binding domain-containing protein [Nitrosomonas europaea]|uniref:excalibur calcium-binding domain-containing protein n=1 Tax=Nitrosomonas TaxID=914 RepID=UPI002491E722|nr:MULTISPECIES: excalibur calcium-binding domain-containing protein [Nitrosomonas]MEB2332476.1 excalibur calcium-binding domain-containing protein [Nitrosomonas sp.]HRO57523.1 excalibur calcium-binding domain-containing protein [Nitrosomonas europaea]HUM74087.1 excalibur calcium-binding domain-containing protein [Nitrosomonas europaea]